MTASQPREHPVPCGLCGTVQGRDGVPRPRTMTFNHSGLCDRHEADVEEGRRVLRDDADGWS